MLSRCFSRVRLHECGEGLMRTTRQVPIVIATHQTSELFYICLKSIVGTSVSDQKLCLI